MLVNVLSNAIHWHYVTTALGSYLGIKVGTSATVDPRQVVPLKFELDPKNGTICEVVLNSKLISKHNKDSVPLSTRVRYIGKLNKAVMRVLTSSIVAVTLDARHGGPNIALMLQEIKDARHCSEPEFLYLTTQKFMNVVNVMWLTTSKERLRNLYPYNRMRYDRQLYSLAGDIVRDLYEQTALGWGARHIWR